MLTKCAVHELLLVSQVMRLTRKHLNIRQSCVEAHVP